MTIRTLSRAGLLALAVLTAAPSAQAQTRVDAELVPFAGGSFFVSDAHAAFVRAAGDGAQLMVQEGELRDGPTFGFSGGLRFADRIGVEGLIAWSPRLLVGTVSVPAQRRVADVSTARFGVSALYHWDQRGPMRPFAGLTVSTETMSSEPHAAVPTESDTGAAVTLGAHVPATDRLALRIQAWQDVLGRADGTRRELMVTVGLSYRHPVR